jgi:AbrB family transcriptional regulator (stage V sporulation protein T)
MDTGVVRKIDELGRIVIPKEIRKNLNIRNGEDVSIFVKDNMIVLKKYERALTIKEISQKYINAFKKINDDVVLISDKNSIISSSNFEYIDKKIDNKIFNLINERKSEEGTVLNLGGEVINSAYIISPIIVDTDAIGAVISLCKDRLNEKSKIFNNVINILITLNLC